MRTHQLRPGWAAAAVVAPAAASHRSRLHSSRRPCCSAVDGESGLALVGTEIRLCPLRPWRAVEIGRCIQPERRWHCTVECRACSLEMEIAARDVYELRVGNGGARERHALT